MRFGPLRRIAPAAGLTAAQRSIVTASRERRQSRASRGWSRRVSYGAQASPRLRERSPPTPAPAFAADVDRTASPQSGFGGSGAGGATNSGGEGLGLKYVGTLTDGESSGGFGEDIIEVYLGSFHQQALIAEAKRVLSQPRNRCLGVKLVAGVAAVGVGRNSIGAIITTSRPYKKVRHGNKN